MYVMSLTSRAEVHLGRGLDAVGVVAEEHRVEVALEDLLLRVPVLEHQRVVDLEHLVADVALQPGEELVLRHLHRDRRRALLRGVRGDVRQGRSEQAAGVHPVVRVELAVLDSEERPRTCCGISSKVTGWLFWRWNTAIRLLSRSYTSVRRDSGWSSGSATGVPSHELATPQMRGHDRHRDGPEQQRRGHRDEAETAQPCEGTHEVEASCGTRHQGGRGRNVAARADHRSRPTSVSLRRAVLDRRRTAGAGSSRPSASRTSATT